jgi:hypothetical protein
MSHQDSPIGNTARLLELLAAAFAGAGALIIFTAGLVIGLVALA